MINNSILDDEMLVEKGESLKKVMEWWEKRRPLYNFILIGWETIIMLYFYEGTLNFGIQESIFWSILYTIVANCSYSLGWIVELQIRYYFPKLEFRNPLKLTLLLLGILFSIWLTWMSYALSLS